MNSNYFILDVFEYSTAAHLVKSKLDAEGFTTMLMDEKTIDTDPLVSQAIGGVKLLVHNNDREEATAIYDQIRTYQKTDTGEDLHCPSCNSTQILIAPLRRKNVFYMLFPFFEKKRYICNHCKTIFR